MYTENTLNVCKTLRVKQKNGNIQTYFLIDDLENYLLERNGLEEFNYLVSFLELTAYYAFFTHENNVYVASRRLSQIKSKSPLFEKLKRECMILDKIHDISYYELISKLMIHFSNLQIKKYNILGNHFIDMVFEKERIALININNVHDLIDKAEYLNENNYAIYEIGRYKSNVEYLLLVKQITKELRHDYDMTA